jgi:probable HAF family extracellular repeat protein
MRILACLILALMLERIPTLLGAEILYSVTDLGTLGGCCAFGMTINNSGQVRGTSTTSDGASHVFLYSDGQMMDLGLAPPGITHMNNVGQIIGTIGGSAPAGTTVLYSNGVATPIGNLGLYGVGGQSRPFTFTRDINDSGQVTGFSATPTSPSHAFLYSDGRMMDLGTLTGDYSEAYAINNLGQVTGAGFLYSNGQMTDLGGLGGGSLGYGISDSGFVTGRSALSASEGIYHAFLYSNGQMKDLGALPGDRYSVGLAVNDSGQVLGLSSLFSGDSSSRPFLYSDGQLLTLTTTIPLGWSQFRGDSFNLNNNGQILVSGSGSGFTNHAFLLTPVLVPEPGSLPLLGTSLLPFIAWASVRRAHRRFS